MNLRIPGPTPCPPDVLAAMGRQMINHRGPEFASVLNKVKGRLKTVFQTRGDVLIFTSSGSGAMEAAVVNTMSPGDRILAVCNGYFGERFADMAEAFGGQVRRLRFPWGAPANPQDIRTALEEDRSIKIILLTHNETSTGITNDLQTIGALSHQFGKLLLVDAVSSLGAIPLFTDDWHCDVVVTGSQKSWMVPPGLAMVGVSEQAWKAVGQAKTPRYYWDFRSMKSFHEKGQTPFTPAVSVFFALEVALERMIAEGLPNVMARHARVARYTRQNIRSLGLELLAPEECASNTVTSIRLPTGVGAKDLLRLMEEKHKIVLAGGQGELDGHIFRIGHLGYVDEKDIDGVINALRTALPELGYTVSGR